MGTVGNGVVVLADARTRTERDLIIRWAAAEHAGATVVERGAELVRAVAGGDPLIVPARVTWLPPERAHNSKPRPTDLLALVKPRRPWPFVQQHVARLAPDAVRVVAGEPATVADLRARFALEDPAGGEAAFAAYVARAGTLACERAERAVIGDRYKVPRLVVEQITATARFRDKVAALATKLGRREQDVLAEVTACLHELVTVQSPPAIDAFRAVLAPMHASAWRVNVDIESLERLRDLNRKHALVFLPAHRSYADPLVVAEVLHEHNFPRNHLLGGNNMSFWPIGALGKRAGAIFIRRDGGDPAYKLALREYFGYLVSKRFNLEWYIEGGRSRTGKLRPPKFGLLKYLTDALDEGRAEDVVLVPVSLVYDHMHELGAMAAEQGGARKRAEGFRWLLRYVLGQRRNEGNAEIRFGEPFSLRGALDDAGEGRARLEKVAFRICDGINAATPVTSVALVTFALLGARDHAVTLAEASRVVAPLLDYLRRRRIPGPVAELRDLPALRGTLDRLTDVGVTTCYDGGSEPVWSISEGKHRVAAFYRNGVVHYLVTRAIVELALLHVADAPESADPIADAWAEALRLRDLLKFEFFFSTKRDFNTQVRAEVDLLGGGDEADALLASAKFLVAPRTLRPFLEAQWVVADRLAARIPSAAIDADAFLTECLGVGQQMLLQGRVRAADSVSRELYATALRLAENRSLVQPGHHDLRQARQAFRAEIADVLDRIERLDQRAGQVLDEVLYANR